uniref:TATA box-binding protein-like 1 n=1 Tax=Strigamia maritima TaxID=126957 RepID=T1JKA4_STRMM
MATMHEENGFCDKLSNDYNVKGNANEAQEEPTQLDIVINNVVCSFSVRCHLNLREIALQANNVEFKRENGMVTMKIRKPYTTASMWSSGKITCTGATSEDLAKVAARRFARTLQKLGFKVRFSNYRVVNVLGTCAMPFAIRIIQFSNDHRANASYEPELHPGVTYKLKDPKATLKIFSTGSITVTAPSVLNVQLAIEHIFPIVYEYRRNVKDGDDDKSKTKRRKPVQRHHNNSNHTLQQENNDIFNSSDDERDNLFDSDRSWD